MKNRHPPDGCLSRDRRSPDPEAAMQDADGAGGEGAYCMGVGVAAGSSGVVELDVQLTTIVAASAIRWSLAQGGPSVARGP